ncbi:50S ribosomal protein L22 [Chlamydia trachomatis]|nr:50S ribosomal protein L22 [Chlamydia trachomatis]
MFKATARYIRVQPRKARLAAGLMRNRSVVEAQQQLSFSQMKAGRCLKKVLDSAIANAESNENIKRLLYPERLPSPLCPRPLVFP